MVETNCDIICAVIFEFTSFTILFISICMPCDTYNNNNNIYLKSNIQCI